MIRPPPPDLVQQHSPLQTPVIGNSPVHRPSPSSSPPYKTQVVPERPVHFRVRRNSTSSVSSKANSAVNGIDRGSKMHSIISNEPFVSSLSLLLSLLFNSVICFLILNRHFLKLDCYYVIVSSSTSTLKLTA